MQNVKLDRDDGPRPEMTISDFALPQEFRRLLERFDRIQNGKVAELEILAGVPRRVVFETRPTIIAAAMVTAETT